MTKRDLLRFLEPYSDDIRIVIEEDMGIIDDANPRYTLAPRQDDDGHTQSELRAFGILPGEGYVLL